MKNDKKRILHIQVFPKLSGVQKISYEILKRLPQDYEKYILFSESADCGDVSKCIEAFEQIGVKVLFSKKLKREIGWSDLGAIYEIFRLCRRYRFDIVHTNSTKPGIVGRIGATFARVPFVIHTVHGLAFHKFVKFPKWQFYWICEMFASFFCDRITIVNRFYMKYFNWFRRKTLTVYNGLDFSDMSRYVRMVRTDKITKVLFVGRLDEQKNPRMLLAGAKKVCDIRPDVRFTIVGDGEYMEYARDFVRSNGLESVIDLVGWSSNVYDYYSTHDIFVTPSIYEAFGLIFVEASYFELPIVATNVEGIPEVVKDGETGLLCAPNDIDAFVRNILFLTADPELARTMGRSGKKRVVAHFCADRMAGEYLLEYEKGIQR